MKQNKTATYIRAKYEHEEKKSKMNQKINRKKHKTYYMNKTKTY